MDPTAAGRSRKAQDERYERHQLRSRHRRVHTGIQATDRLGDEIEGNLVSDGRWDVNVEVDVNTINKGLNCFIFKALECASCLWDDGAICESSKSLLEV